MAWRFWRRQNTERPEITLYSAAAYPVMLLLEKKPPFDLLLRLPQDPEVPEEFTGCCFIFSLAYTFVTYLILLRTQFGPELGRIVRENLGIQFNRLSNSESEGDRQLSLLFDLIVRVEDAALRAAEIHARDQEEERKIVVGDITLNAADFPVEFDIALTLLCRFPESPIVQAHGQVDTVAHIPEGLDIKLTEVLDQTKRQAVAAFTPLVAAMHFQSESVDGLKLK